ncbi:MAG: beta-ketoacyl synthase N-terminal-like domain-containing protein, partial [Terracidiphilus sp.]
DAGIDLAKMDRSRIAVFFATGFGCVELTEAFFQSAATHGWAETDPIIFPETLSNAPASHVALFHDLHGPNVTIGSQGFAAESALLQASSLLRHGQADLAIVLAGDTLTQAVYEWYETAHLLSPACFSNEPLPSAGGFIPSEGVVAMVLEATGRQESRPYAALGAGSWAAGGDAQSGVRQLLGDTTPRFTICAGNGGPCASRHTTCSARDLVGEDATIYPSQPVATGIGDASAHLLTAALPRCDWSYFESQCTHCSSGLCRASRRRDCGGDSGAGTAQGGDHAGAAEFAGETKGPGQSWTQPRARLRRRTALRSGSEGRQGGHR